jgi:hypothetical protein
MAASKHTPGRRSSKDKISHTRTLKVRKGFYSRIIKDKDHSSFDRTVYAAVPWINLQGQWLDQAGFSIHTPIKIRVMEGCLVVTAETSSG